MPRLTGRQTHRSNVPAADPKEYWKLSLFYPFLDHLLSELETRLVYPSDRFSAQYLVPSNLHKLNPEIEENLFVPFASDISDEMAALQESELSRWKTKWQGQDDIPDSICETLRHANSDLYPNISVALTVLLTMPISSATAERSFSAMRRIKNYMRSTMNEERLSGLALMHIHRDFAIDVDAVLKKFASDGNRRIAYAFSY
ncbi:putative 52 kDa repressor of the inhibitor of the protein kinase-like [Apostichopus japonicus]|uniref:Putative 52 kDa repressor of the inhibitor of the protein kinase-like n=1 Tax=Stichopus japonicus TaxID=307972 RepID=A0A2G8JM39_STIJA|nr:putative 52 kDa repressor of the inhibitor of the protein kinase-like [Apostichopus japonicus]